MQAHRAECDVRDRRLRVREEEIGRRNTDLVYLLRRARKYEATAKRTQHESGPSYGRRGRRALGTETANSTSSSFV